MKPGKGGAFVRTKLKSLVSGSVVDKTFRAGEKMPRSTRRRRTSSTSTTRGDDVVFMDQETRAAAAAARRGRGELDFLQPSASVQLLTGRPPCASSCRLRSSSAAETKPGVRGDTVSNVTKPATLETGAVVQVPLFVNVGDRIKVDMLSAARRSPGPKGAHAAVGRHDDPAPVAGAACRAGVRRGLYELAGELDKAGFACLEVSGGGCFDSAVRRGVESPLGAASARSARAARRRSGWRSAAVLVGAAPVSGDLVRRFVATAAGSGIDVFRIHDPLNDLSNLREAADAIRDAGKELSVGLVHSPGPTGETEALLERANQLAGLGGARAHPRSGQLAPPGQGPRARRARQEASGSPSGCTARARRGCSRSRSSRSGPAQSGSHGALYPVALSPTASPRRR